MEKSATLEALRRGYRDYEARHPDHADSIDEDDFLDHLHRGLVAEGEELEPDRFPGLQNFSAAFFYEFLPIPIERQRPEFVYVPSDIDSPSPRSLERIKESVTVTEWNITWEASQLRPELFRRKLPRRLKWLARHHDQNVFLVPRCRRHRYSAYAPLFHLIPEAILARHDLPYLRRGVWPHYLEDVWRECLIPDDFDRRLPRAFADLVWSSMSPGSGHSAFADSDPLRLLAHNLDFWLPYAYEVAEERLRQMPRVRLKASERAKLQKARSGLPAGIQIVKPRKGGTIWEGEADAKAALNELVEKADAHGNLRGLIEAVRSNRVEEDFSARWSYAKEDFERKLYRKRSKVRVKFVELFDTIPVHGPESEVHESMLWEDFLGLLNPKERQITVLLRSGVTKLGDIAKAMGYANHSPISKALSRIRRQALRVLS